MQSQPVSHRARPLLGIVLLLALPLAAWSAMNVQASPRREAVAAAATAPLITTHTDTQSELRDWMATRERKARVARWTQAIERARAEQRLRDVANVLQAIEAHKQRVAIWDTLAQCETQQNW